jgi:hypothetical protein
MGLRGRHQQGRMGCLLQVLRSPMTWLCWCVPRRAACLAHGLHFES